MNALLKSIIPPSYDNLSGSEKLEIALCLLESALDQLGNEVLDADGINYESKDLADNISKFLIAMDEDN